jgi:hypothetical protein
VCLGATAIGGGAAPVEAQSDATVAATGSLLVRVRRSDSTAVVGAFVRSGRIAGVTDSTGVATIELPAALRTITVTSPGYRARSFEMTIVAGAPNRVDIFLSPTGPEDEPVVSGLRREARIGSEATAVEVLSAERLTDVSLGHPTDLVAALSRVDGLTIQAANGALAGGRVRWFGSPSDLTTILVDGVPLLGGYPGAFGVMELSPLEFSQVEAARGAASAWYGPIAGLNVVNLVSKRPERTGARVQADQSSEKGGDVVFSGASRFSPTMAGTVIAEFHQQRLVDADDDNWGEFPRAIRVGIRPRFFLDRPNGDGLILTAGAFGDDRTGGFLFNPNTGQDVYREERNATGGNASLIGWHGAEATGRINLKLMVGGERVKYDFDGFLEHHHRTSVFGELSYARVFGPARLEAGLAYQADAVYHQEVTGYDFSYVAPGAFAQGTVTRDRWTGTLATRCDRHNEFGSQCGANLAIQIQPMGGLRFKVSGGTGVYAPTLYSEETETADLRGLVPSGLDLERIKTATGDVQWRSGAFEVGATVNFDRIEGAVRSVSVVGDPALRGVLVNLPEPTRVNAFGVRAVYRRDPFYLRASYVHQNGSESDSSVGTARRALDHLPSDLGSLEIGVRPGPGDGRISLITHYVGPAPLWDDPFRVESKSYVMSDLVLSQRSGRARLYLSGENLLDVKQRADEPVILPVPWLGDRRTTMPAKPLRGRVLSFGATVEW